MTGVYITLAIGAAIIFFDYRIGTAPDEKDKHKRRRPLSPVDRKQLRDLVKLTIIVAFAVWAVQQLLD